MSRRQCCYKQQHSKLWTEDVVFKCPPVIHGDTCGMPLPDCHINNTPIQFATSCGDMQTLHGKGSCA